MKLEATEHLLERCSRENFSETRWLEAEVRSLKRAIASCIGMTHPLLSIDAMSTFNWSFDQDLALWKDLGVRHAGLLISKIADDPAREVRTLASRRNPVEHGDRQFL